MLCLIVLLAGGVVYYIEYELQDIDALNTVQLQTPLQIYTNDKKLMATFGENRRIPLPYQEIPKQLIDAVLATEDQRYFRHGGVDLPGIGRAAIQLLLTGRKSQGGSTITMQVARSFYLTRQKTFARKLREILFAIKIEHKVKKEKILELYLNKIFFGNRAYGVEAAAEIYYGKHVSGLRLDQYAVLAGLPKAPSTLNPLANPEASKKRRDHVLYRMYDQGYITKAQYDDALKAPIDARYHDLQTEVKAPYAAELVREQLEQMYGDSIYTDGYKVYTTINSKLQHAANKAVREQLLAYDERHGYRGPIDNLGEPSLTNMDDWQKNLMKRSTVNELEPAAVVDMTDKTITVLRQSGDLTILPWDTMSWARKQINADYLGPMPKRASQIVKTGDVVYVYNGKEGKEGPRFVQMPKAEAGLVAMAPQNGAILAMVGGFDYQSSKFNVMTLGKRQPGSSFKPFVYSAALDKGFTLSTVINDAPIVVQQEDDTLWRPQNVNRKFYGPTRLRVAITESRNLVTIRLLALMGLPYTINHLTKFGFVRSQLPPGLSLALGTAMVTPLQMAQGFTVFANGGYKVVPYMIDTIRNSNNQLIYQAKPLVACSTGCAPNQAKAPHTLSAQNAFLVTSALQDVIRKGTGKEAMHLGRNDLAGKTGTTQDQVDAWFAGYNPDLVAVAWVGFKQPQSLHEYGAQAALPVWMQFMRVALAGKSDKPFTMPPDIVAAKVNAYSGKLTDDDDDDALNEYFMASAMPGRETYREQLDDENNSSTYRDAENNVTNNGNATNGGGADAQQELY